MSSIKICGITLMEDAIAAADCGASAIGFIFYSKSPRYISPEKAKEIVMKVGSRVSFVGVFVDKPLDYVHAISDTVGLDFIQLHGNEPPEYCDLIKLPVLKAFRVNENFDSDVINQYKVHAFLFDTYRKGVAGGTGKVFNWRLISDLETNTPIIISGGLNIDNIIDSIKAVSPNSIDINSGV
ncbi:uncharacterized protein METZ01_LOCUS467385, partial [marine metagenome]